MLKRVRTVYSTHTRNASESTSERQTIPHTQVPHKQYHNIDTLRMALARVRRVTICWRKRTSAQTRVAHVRTISNLKTWISFTLAGSLIQFFCWKTSLFVVCWVHELRRIVKSSGCFYRAYRVYLSCCILKVYIKLAYFFEFGLSAARAGVKICFSKYDQPKEQHYNRNSLSVLLRCALIVCLYVFLKYTLLWSLSHKKQIRTLTPNISTQAANRFHGYIQHNTYTHRAKQPKLGRLYSVARQTSSSSMRTCGILW